METKVLPRISVFNELCLSLEVCSIHPDLKEAIKKFRFRKETNNAAIIMKVNAEDQNVVIEEMLDVEDVDDLKNNITDTQPRFALLSWTIKHKDGRTSYPMAFIFFTPRDCKPQLQMMYAGTYKRLIEECQLTKVFQIRDIDELDDEWIETNLAK
ncbi:Glia maturation factor gamma [Armadillidium nasatum]|uniref:Glia maturation factor gamma n=2 Tax=Armadillidium nasatum TaxID=96803 RepID=A0A5N5TGK6_9CRUS|nr:Glia maturation factor gamma [Armadillidium nasatum]